MTGGKWKHMTGDCLDLIEQFPEKSFNLILTDPPYAMPATYYNGRNAKRRWSDTSIMQTWWRLVIETAWPLLKPNAMICVFCNAAALVAFYPPIFEKCSNVQVAVWDKDRIGLGRPLRNQTEFILCGSVGIGYAANKGKSNVFRFKSVTIQKRIHPAQKPTGLIKELVEHFCPVGGRVLDPFAGSLVTGQVCQSLGIECVTMEYDETDGNIGSLI